MELRDICTARAYTDKATGQEKKSWYKIGTAFIHSDGKIGLQFAAFPVTGDCMLFERKQKDGYQAQPQTQSSPPASDESLPF